MDERKKEQLGKYAVPLGVGIITLVIGLIGSYFFLLVIGTVTVFVTLFNLIYIFISKANSDSVPNGMGCGCLVIIAAFSLLALKFNDTRYISPHGSKQHIYVDCRTISKNKNVSCVSELEAMFHLCFSDCSICETRKAEERRIKRELRKQREREEKIEELQQKIDALRNGADVEDIEDEIDEEDYDEPPMGVPSRYW